MDGDGPESNWKTTGEAVGVWRVGTIIFLYFQAIDCNLNL
jgi:hypothetical protein